MMHPFFRYAAAALAGVFLLAVRTEAHPIPDIPVRGSFAAGGDCTVSVEVDLRCFDANPAEAPSLLNWVFRTISAEQRAGLQKQAAELVQRCVEFHFEPLGQVRPQFAFEFTKQGGGALEKDEDIVVLTGTWKTAVPAGISGWKIRATPETKLAVVFQNIIDGETHPRLAVLFPGETSFTLDLTELTGAVPKAPTAGAVSLHGSSKDVWGTFGYYLRYGFVHVLPKGLDHILFVLGLFLLSRAWRPLIWQVTMFTLAHTITLALATLGFVKVQASIVEPVIALSIAAVAIENIFHPRYTRWRLIVVFIFGLVHGLGFASVLAEELSKASLAVGLVGFNIGVECAQLTVIALALLVTGWLRDPARYRQWIVIPASACIALAGLFWAVQRVIG